MENKYSGLEVAVIGISCRVPNAENYKEFWVNLINGFESVEKLSLEEVIKSGINEELAKSENYIKVQRKLQNKEYFDSPFFNYNQNEANLLSPQSRQVHECLWEAVEDSGYDVKTIENSSLFLGINEDYTWKVNVFANRDKFPVDLYSFNFLSEHLYLPALLSYKFGFRGITMPVITACSSSLVAVHNAYKSLLLGESNIAFAGGVNISNEKIKGYLFEEGKIESKDGHCRAFDINSSGTSWGEGVGFVVLKRLKDAIKDNDNIHCIIKGGAINNDSNRRVGYTSPSIVGQTECIKKALKFSQVNPNSISYIETHGTGTQLGDPIEVEALNKGYDLKEKNTIPIGSVKSNIGHLNFASGIIGFIKASLCLKYKMIPPSINFKEPNPNINFKNGPFYVNEKLSSLQTKANQPLRTAVTSLGIGGTNAHMILEESPTLLNDKKSNSLNKPTILTVSAKTKNSLTNNVIKLKNFLENEDVDLLNTAYTYRTSRSAFDLRKSFLFSDKGELITKLNEFIKLDTSKKINQNQNLVFMFSGQGSQYINMGKSLYLNSTVFKENLDIAIELLNEISGKNFSEIFFPTEVKLEEEINNTFYAQPIIFVFQYCFSQFLISVGLNPKYLIGHSLGEYTAACLSGVFTYQEGIRIIYERARMMSSVTEGRMISVNISAVKLTQLLQIHCDVFISGENYSDNYVLSGLTKDIEEITETLKKESIAYIELPSKKPFHTKYFKSIESEFKLFLEKFSFNGPKISFISCLTGDFINNQECVSSDYWVSQMQQKVCYEKGVKKLISRNENLLFIDIGPNNTNTKILRNIDNTQRCITFFSKNNEYHNCIDNIGKIWETGIGIEWQKIFENQTRISLPTYSFEKYKFITDINSFDLLFGATKKPKKYHTYKEIWIEQPKLLNTIEYKADKRILLFSDNPKISSQLLSKVDKENYFIVKRAKNYSKKGNVFTLNPNNIDDFKLLFKDLKEQNFIVSDLFFVWSKKTTNSEEGINYGYLTLFNIVVSHNFYFFNKDLTLSFIANGLFKTQPYENIYPIKSTAVSAIRVIIQEFENINYKIIDTDDFNTSTIKDIFDDSEKQKSNIEIAIRNQKLFIKDYKKVKIKPNKFNVFSAPKTYLVTGGYGGLGFEITKYIADKFKSNLVILGRNDEDVEKTKTIKNLGSLVYYIKSNLNDFNTLSKELNQAQKKIGVINGVIHTSGVGDFNGIILTRDPKNDATVLDPKIVGTQNLFQILSNNQLEFFVGFSSRVASKPFIGQYAYSAANNYLDNFLASNNGISIQWPIISETGMAVKALNNLPEYEKESILTNSINPKCLIKILFKAIHSAENLIIVTKKDLKDESQELETEPIQETILSRNDLNINAQYVKPETKIEIEITNIVKEVLCINDIGMFDNIYEIGGDSLKAMVILNKINSKYQVEYPLKNLLDKENIKAIVQDVEEILDNKITITI